MISAALKIVCVALVFQGCLSAPAEADHDTHVEEASPEPSAETCEQNQYAEDVWDEDFENRYQEQFHDHDHESIESVDQYIDSENAAHNESNNNSDNSNNEAATNPEIEAPLDSSEVSDNQVAEQPEENSSEANLVARDLKATIADAREISKQFIDEVANQEGTPVTGLKLSDINSGLAASLSKLQSDLNEDDRH